MYISSFLTVSSLAAITVAQTTSYSYIAPTTSTCAAQAVFDACFASTTAIIQTCASTDYSCLCSKYNDLLTCFLQCPNDSRIGAAQSSHATYCSDASQYPTTTSSAISKAVSSAATTQAGTASGAATTESSGAVRVASSTNSGSSASASASTTAKSDAKKGLIFGAGSVAMGLAGLAAAVL